MKFDVRYVIFDHFATLRDSKGKKFSFLDLTFFYFAPISFGVFVYYLDSFTLSKEAYSLSVTFYGIFIALLLNMQVAIFGIFQRKNIGGSDKGVEKEDKKEIISSNDIVDLQDLRTTILGETNSNISYLILVCCIALAIFFGFFVYEKPGRIQTAISVTINVHFLFTLLMIVKRVHVLFAEEYRR